MGHENLRILLEVGGDDNNRHVAGDRVEGKEEVAAHIEVKPAGRE